jgi:flagellar hook protein FlgE
MSLFGALSASLTNLTAQSSAVNIISNNIANLNTRGFKNSEASFSTLVTGSTGGGVLQRSRQDIGSQGAVQSTNVSTDLAVQGRGFFVVKDTSGTNFYTRAGSFRTDSTGNLVNESGYILQGWPLDTQGRLPGEAGNTTNTRSNQDLASLTQVSTSDIAGKASPTRTITTKLNLNASESTLEGAGDATAFPTSSSNNGIGSTAIIVPSASTTVEGANATTGFPSSGSNNTGINSTTIIVPSSSFASGTTISLKTGSGADTAATYTYGGFATSTAMTVGTPIFAATSASTNFSGLTDGNSFTIASSTTLTSPVTFTYRASSPSTSSREFSNLNDLATAINTVTGLTARVVNDQIYIAPTDANESLTFANVAGGIPAGLGLTNTTTGTNRFATLANLNTRVNATTGFTGVVSNPTTTATLKIRNENVLDNLTFDSSDTDLLTELGLSTTQINSPYNFLPTSTLTIRTNSGNTTAGSYTYGGFEVSKQLSSATPIFGASTANATFTSLTDGDSFTIATSSTLTTPVTFTYKPSATTSARQFNSLSQLAEAINAVTGLTARVSNNMLFVAPADANESMTFANVAGNIPSTLGLTNTTTGSGRFASLANLNTLANATNGISGTIASATSNSVLTLFNDDPTDTVLFGGTDTDLLTELGLTTTQVASVYDPDNSAGGKSMASGTISADFSRTITIYTSLGNPLDLRLAFVKIGTNKWGVEVFAADKNQVSSSYPSGLLGFGQVEFNGDGTLNSITSSATQAGAKITGPITILPTGGAVSQTISLNLGTAGASGRGLADGLAQFSGSYTVDRAAQDGAPTGRLQSLQIDAQGFVTAVFDNSLTQRVYKLPIAYVANPNGLQAESGNAYSATRAAGEVTLGQVGNPSVGNIVPGALEVSNSDLGGELTKMITTQQAYSASANVIRKINDLFDELKNL